MKSHRNGDRNAAALGVTLVVVAVVLVVIVAAFITTARRSSKSGARGEFYSTDDISYEAAKPTHKYGGEDGRNGIADERSVYFMDSSRKSDSGILLSGRYATLPETNDPRSAGLVSTSFSADTAPLDRKIIYTANVDLIVESFEGVNEKVAELVKKSGGYIADSTLSGSKGENRRATWKIRVPADRFEELVDNAKNLGELVTANTNSRDVSEEYYDVDARIRNKTKEEERLLKLLEDRPGKLEDVIAIERELSRVREELERMQGRMRFLADQTTMTTVQLGVREVHDYRPAQAATFGTRITRALEDSLVSLRETGEFLVVAGVAVLPWLVALTVLFTAVYLLVRSRFRKAAARTNPA